METNTSVQPTDYARIAAAIRHLAYVRAHGSLKLDGPERHELEEAIALLHRIMAAPVPPAWITAAIDAYITDAPEPDEIPEAMPAEFVQPLAPWYLGHDGALFYVPEFPIDQIPF